MKTLKATCMAGIAAVMLSATVPAMAQPFGYGGGGYGYDGPRYYHGGGYGYRHHGPYGYGGGWRGRYRDGYGYGPRHRRGFYDGGRGYGYGRY